MSEPLQNQSLVVPPPPSTEDAEIMRIKNDRALAEFTSPFSSAAAYRHFEAVAKVFAASVFVPDHFKNKPGECLIAIDIARRMGESELMVMQQMYVVKGRPGFSTKFMIARANRLAGFQSTIKWTKEVLGEPIKVTVNRKVDGNRRDVTFSIPNMRVTAYAIDRFGERIENSVDTAMAIAEGWIENAKYESMPEHMFRWRSSSMLINLYAPEVMMGMQTTEELETMKDVTPVSEPIAWPSQLDAFAANGAPPAQLTAGSSAVGVIDLTGTQADSEGLLASPAAHGKSLTAPAADLAAQPKGDDLAVSHPPPQAQPAELQEKPATVPRLTQDKVAKLLALMASEPKLDEEDVAFAFKQRGRKLEALEGVAGETSQALYTRVLSEIQRLKGK